MKRSLKSDSLIVSDYAVEYIVDFVHEQFQDSERKIIEAQNRVNKIFLHALGRKTFYEVKESLEKDND